MLSICIPIYNFDVRSLVDELYNQAEELSLEYEIVCLDDHSDESFHIINQSVADKAKYIRLDENIGRARIRNQFLLYTQYNYLLFLDCDVVPANQRFLSVYADLVFAKPAVICGGKRCAKVYDKQHKLRYHFDRKCECMDVDERQARPRHSFSSANFIVRRSVLESIPFDERVSQYGYEDTLFAYQLLKRNISITHADNNVVHIGTENNSEFLEKNKVGISNLVQIYKWMGQDDDFIQMDSILIAYRFCQRFKLLWLVNLSFSLLGNMLEKWFTKGFGNMMLFRFYKLGLLSKAMPK